MGGTTLLLPLTWHGSSMTAMKRIAATVLWFFVGWYVAAAAAWLIGIPSAIAPIVAIVIAAIVWIDPRNRLWVSNPHPQTSDPSASAAAVAGLIR
jgi:hypothetical protein